MITLILAALTVIEIVGVIVALRVHANDKGKIERLTQRVGFLENWRSSIRLPEGQLNPMYYEYGYHDEPSHLYYLPNRDDVARMVNEAQKIALNTAVKQDVLAQSLGLRYVEAANLPAVPAHYEAIDAKKSVRLHNEDTASGIPVRDLSLRARKHGGRS